MPLEMGPHEGKDAAVSSLPHVQFGKQFDSVDIRPDGTSLLSSSNLTSRYWTGNLAIFGNPNSLGLVTGCKLSLDFDAGIPCARFLGDTSRAILTLDSGYVNIVRTDADVAADSAVLASVCEHDDVVSALDLSADFSVAVTGSYDRSLKLWDTSHLICSATYRPAHKAALLSVAVHPANQHLAASCSEDGQIRMWDFRLPRPAVKVEGEFSSRPSCVAFRGSDSDNLLIGTITGDILEVDPTGAAKTPQLAPLLHIGAHRRPVRKLVAASHDNSVVASCADDEKTVVVSINAESPKILYSDNRHDDFVRGLSWAADGRLFTCGWDRRVLSHDVLASTTVA